MKRKMKINNAPTKPNIINTLPIVSFLFNSPIKMSKIASIIKTKIIIYFSPYFIINFIKSTSLQE